MPPAFYFFNHSYYIVVIFKKMTKNTPMRKHATTSLFLMFFTTIVFAQESNLKEDYSALVPEVLFFNKMFLLQDKPISILTKEGIDRYRNVMKNFVPAKTILQ